MLDEPERDCPRRYCELPAARLGGGLVRVRMLGSAARVDTWPAHSPMHSDVDLLVVTRTELPATMRENLIDETYPLSLECGRQLSPHFLGEARVAAPGEERTRAFIERVAEDGVDVWSSR